MSDPLSLLHSKQIYREPETPRKPPRPPRRGQSLTIANSLPFSNSPPYSENQISRTPETPFKVPQTPRSAQGVKRSFSSLDQESSKTNQVVSKSSLLGSLFCDEKLFSEETGEEISEIDPSEHSPVKKMPRVRHHRRSYPLPPFQFDKSCLKPSDQDGELFKSLFSEECGDKQEVNHNSTLFLDLNLNASKAELDLPSAKVKIEPFSEEGTYMSVYTVQTVKEPIIAGVDNKNLVIKLFNKLHSTKRPDILMQYMSNSLANYEAAKKLGIEVATIYNSTTAKQDGFYIQEKIPFTFDITKEHLVKQVRDFILKALRNKEVFDLHHGNIRVREDGTAVLIDFIEETFTSKGKEETQLTLLTRTFTNYLIPINQAVKSYCSLFKFQVSPTKEDTKAFLDSFTEGFEEYGYDMKNNEAIMDELFFEVKSRYILKG